MISAVTPDFDGGYQQDGDQHRQQHSLGQDPQKLAAEGDADH